jgi:hypothetical protein
MTLENTINTSPEDFFPIEQMQLMKFDGQAWQRFGGVLTDDVIQHSGQ